ncbi:MAG: glycosyltransferase family 4 protein [Acidimicrobiales bacterium]
MRALWITCHLPHPASSGGRLRELELLRRLAPAMDVELIAVSKTPEADVEAAQGFDLPARTTVVAAEADETARCAQVARHASRAATAAVADALTERTPDLVHVEGFYLMQHLPPAVDVPELLVDQNIEAALWAQRAAVATDVEAERAALAEARRCEAAEVAAWRRADLCAFVTEDDAELARSIAPDLRTRVVPDGADHLSPMTAGVLAPAPDRPTMCFVGNFAYEPNVDAARFLLTEVLPRVRREVPDVHLQLVGNAPPDWLRAEGDRSGATVTGWVPSVTPYLATADVVVCPLRVGGGVKVKVLEALSVGAAVVTTPVGAQGLRTDLGAPLVVEPTATRVAGAVSSLLGDPQARHRLRAAARATARSMPTWDEAATSLSRCYAELAGRPVAEAVPA